MKLPLPFDDPYSYPAHSGVDFPQRRGTPIRASGQGVVVRTSHNAKGGYWTVIRYDGLPDEIGYAHQDRPVTVVHAGQRVSLGQVIGYVGSLGTNSTGPHLHLERLNKPGYASTISLFDTGRVVGQPAPAGDLKPLPTPTPAQPEEEDDMFKPTVHARTEGTPEWALGHPDIGKGLTQYTGPGTGTKKTQGPVTIYRGFMVTADRDIAAAWARTYAHGIGNLTSATDRAGYIAIQVELSRLATEIG